MDKLPDYIWPLIAASVDFKLICLAGKADRRPLYSLSPGGLRVIENPSSAECQWLLEWLHAEGMILSCDCSQAGSVRPSSFIRVNPIGSYTWVRHRNSPAHACECPLYHQPKVGAVSAPPINYKKRDDWVASKPLDLDILGTDAWAERIRLFQIALLNEAGWMFWDRNKISEYRHGVVCEAAEKFYLSKGVEVSRRVFTANADYWHERLQRLKGDEAQLCTFVCDEVKRDGYRVKRSVDRQWHSAEVHIQTNETELKLDGNQKYILTAAALRKPGQDLITIIGVAQPICSERVWFPVRSSNEKKIARKWLSLALSVKGKALHMEHPAEMIGDLILGWRHANGEVVNFPAPSKAKDLLLLLTKRSVAAI